MGSQARRCPARRAGKGQAVTAPKPLTKEEWNEPLPTPTPSQELLDRIVATIDALFRYRERTMGMYSWASNRSANIIAAEEGIE